MATGDLAGACPKLAASQKLDPGMGTKFRLADCYEKIGKTASAWALFISLGDESRAAKRKDREEVARKRAAELAPKLARMTISVAPESAKLASLEVRRDGIALDKAVWGVPLPVDPGEHFLTATAPGKKAWESKPVVALPSKTVEVTIPALEDLPKEVITKVLEPGLLVVEKRSLVPAVVLGGVAVVAAGIGGALFAVSKGKETDARDQAAKIGDGHCRRPPSPANDAVCLTLIDTAESADSLHNAAVGMFIGAGVAGAAAVVYLLLPPPAAKKALVHGLRATPIVGAGQAGFLLSGAF